MFWGSGCILEAKAKLKCACRGHVGVSHKERGGEGVSRLDQVRHGAANTGPLDGGDQIIIEKRWLRDFPRDAVEMQLCDIWQFILERPVVRVNEDLFELGGNSLSGVRILSEVARLFGVELELREFFIAPTILTLAERIRSAPSSGGQGAIVRMQTGTGGPPLYVFHPLPGTLNSYMRFVRAFDADQTVWGIQSVGIGAGEKPLESIEAMGEEYLDQMLNVHPGGPWHLFGFSMGGLLAFEVARHLKSLGEPLGLVGLGDTFASTSVSSSSPHDIRRDAVRGLARHALHLNVDLDQLSEQPPERQLHELLDQAISAGSLPRDYNSDRMRRLLEVRMHNHVAGARYEPRPFDGRVVLFKASNSGREANEIDSSDDGCNGWRRLVRDIVVHDLPEEHLDILKPPAVYQIVKLIRECIESQTPNSI